MTVYKNIAEATENIQKWKKEQEIIVFTNGCFDLLHLGHIDYLTKAKALGSKLIVGLNSDTSVKRLKGSLRPINDQLTRSTFLACLRMVDMVIIFEEDDPLKLILRIQPDILVKGGDYTIDTIIGAKEVQENGGLVTTIPFLEGYSSTELIKKIRNRYE